MYILDLESPDLKDNIIKYYTEYFVCGLTKSKKERQVTLALENLEKDLLSYKKQERVYQKFDDQYYLKLHIHLGLVFFSRVPCKIIGKFDYYNDGDKSHYFYKDGLLHRDEDQPSIIFYKNHKLFKPYDGTLNYLEIVYQNSEIHYYKEGKLHREGNKPAIISYHFDIGHNNGFNVTYGISERYYINGELHRDDDENGNPQPASFSTMNAIYDFYKHGIYIGEGDSKGKLKLKINN